MPFLIFILMLFSFVPSSMGASSRYSVPANFGQTISSYGTIAASDGTGGQYSCRTVAGVGGVPRYDCTQTGVGTSSTQLAEQRQTAEDASCLQKGEMDSGSGSKRSIDIACAENKSYRISNGAICQKNGTEYYFSHSIRNVSLNFEGTNCTLKTTSTQTHTTDPSRAGAPYYGILDDLPTLMESGNSVRIGTVIPALRGTKLADKFDITMDRGVLVAKPHGAAPGTTASTLNDRSGPTTTTPATCTAENTVTVNCETIEDDRAKQYTHTSATGHSCIVNTNGNLVVASDINTPLNPPYVGSNCTVTGVQKNNQAFTRASRVTTFNAGEIILEPVSTNPQAIIDELRQYLTMNPYASMTLVQLTEEEGKINAVVASLSTTTVSLTDAQKNEIRDLAQQSLAAIATAKQRLSGASGSSSSSATGAPTTTLVSTTTPSPTVDMITCSGKINNETIRLPKNSYIIRSTAQNAQYVEFKDIKECQVANGAALIESGSGDHSKANMILTTSNLGQGGVVPGFPFTAPGLPSVTGMRLDIGDGAASGYYAHLRFTAPTSSTSGAATTISTASGASSTGDTLHAIGGGIR